MGCDPTNSADIELLSRVMNSDGARIGTNLTPPRELSANVVQCQRISRKWGLWHLPEWGFIGGGYRNPFNPRSI